MGVKLDSGKIDGCILRHCVLLNLFSLSYVNAKMPLLRELKVEKFKLHLDVRASLPATTRR